MTILKILVVEDDLLVADALRQTLTSHNYAVEVASDGQTGLDFIEAFDYDLLLLDVLLPKRDGISICRQVRSQGHTMPILLLTSQNSNHDRAVGLDAGADDYAVKPFDPEELAARIRALLRRVNDRAQPILVWEKLSLNPCNCEVTYQNQLLTLTPKEYALLELFLRHSRRVFSCGTILGHLWTYQDAPSEEAVRTHIKGLRHKLKRAGAPTDLVETVYGIGYRLKPPLVSTQPAPDLGNTQQLLTDIWHRHHHKMIDRVVSIEQFAIACQDLPLDPELRTQAWHSAHALAGGLGTFGLPVGSQIAKQLELLLQGSSDITPMDILQLQGGIDELYRQIASKNSEIVPTPSTPELPIFSPIRLPHLLVITQSAELATDLQAAATNRLELELLDRLPPLLDPQPQSIILDLDGFDDAADGLVALAVLNRDYPTVPMLVLTTATDNLNLRIEVARRGARLLIPKPITAQGILRAVDRILPHSQPERARILIVDDDLALLDYLTVILAPLRLAVTTLSEPGKFWETLKNCVPDLLILDLDMPMHSGIELCQAVRTDPRWVNLPIMFLTAHTAEKAIDRVFAAGADDFATKPIVAEALVSRITHRLERIGLRPLHGIGLS